MNLNEKKRILELLTEDQLRNDVIIPLLNRLEFYYPVEYHGQGERGKDILFYDKNKFGRNRFYAAVVKIGDITGDISSNRSFREIIFQIEQCFNIPYKNIYNMQELFVDHVFFFTSGRVRPNSENSIFETLKKQNLDKLVTIISREQLLELIDGKYDSFWNNANETKEGLLIQRERILNFLTDILIKFGVEKSNIQNIRKQIINSKYDLSIIKDHDYYNLKSSGSYILYNEIKNDDYDYMYSDQCGIINKAIEKTRENIKYSMYDVEEILDNYNKLMLISDPEDFITFFEDNLQDKYPFTERLFGRSSDAINSMGYLEDGLNDIRIFNKFLEKQDIIDVYNRNCKYVINQNEDIKEIIKLCTNDTIRFYIEKNVNNEIKVNNNPTKLDIINIELKKYEEKIRRFLSNEEKILVEITSEKIIDEILYRYRRYIEKEYNFKWDEYADE